MASFFRAINSKIRANPTLNYVFSTRMCSVEYGEGADDGLRRFLWARLELWHSSRGGAGHAKIA
jgi:hypothetical protein